MLFNSKATDVLDTRPPCDVCRAAIVPQTEPAIADAKTNQGPWAYVCTRHFTSMGCKLGEGRGQVLLCGDGLDWGLITRFKLAKATDPTARERVVMVEAEGRRA